MRKYATLALGKVACQTVFSVSEVRSDSRRSETTKDQERLSTKLWQKLRERGEEATASAVNANPSSNSIFLPLIIDEPAKH